MIELYIENKKIDLTDDLEINFTYESIDPDKLSSIKNSFSKTVNIPGTANNNITFGHIFRYDKYIPVSGPVNIESYYDPHKKVSWFINKNGSVINRGYCTLDNIIVKNEKNITYQLTLYGGIGEFFYSLSYNDDGSPKTLYDMFWNWWPKTGLVGHGTALNESEENTRTLYTCSASIIASSYHNLDPLYQASGTTEIDKDVVFIPSYSGLYEDFDSKHMLVSTFNQNYPHYPRYISNDTENKLKAAFPDSDEDYGNEGFTTLDKDFSSTDSYKYGLVTFPRDIDPWEAGDIRVNEMPIGIRLSKMMEVISNSKNNGGYEVIWDPEIKNSYHWLYSWVMLGKLKQENEDLVVIDCEPSETYDGQKTIINVDYTTGVSSLVSGTTAYDIPVSTQELKKGNYHLTLNVLPNINFVCRDFDYYYYTLGYKLISGSMYDDLGSNYRYVYNTPVIIHKIYSGNTLIKSVADIFYFSSDPSNYYFGWNKIQNANTQISAIKTVLNGQIYSRFGVDRLDCRYHNCKLEDPTEIRDNLLYLVDFNCHNEQINIDFDIDSDINDFRIEQSQYMMFTNIYPNPTAVIYCGVYGTDNITFTTHPSNKSTGPFGFIDSEYHTVWSYNNFTLSEYQNNSNASFNLNDAFDNGILSTKSSGYNIIKLDKKTLFAKSKEPLKYLSGFCKMMNYKFICDDVNKKIYIKTLKNYYLDRTVDLDSKVDIGRDINIKNVITKYKNINIGLNTPETYPVYLFNKISKDKFNIHRQDTGIKYNSTETNLLDDLVYDNLIDYQQSSIYYNLNPQFSRSYNVDSISWTLFKMDSNYNVSKKEIFTKGTPSTSVSLLANVDFLPKISLFSKENKEVDFESSLVFLNGFVKNYDYSLVGERTSILTPDSIIESSYINSSGVQSSSSYQDIYVYNNIDKVNDIYRVTASFSNGYTSYTVFCYNEAGVLLNGGKLLSQQGQTYTDTLLSNIPNGTTTIKCNFRKVDTNAKLTITGDYYSISPRVSFSNDMVEQYYLNQGRCYMYDFKYDDVFTSWGAYSINQKGTASSWILPLFTRDLYNSYDSEEGWNYSNSKLASWNIVDQEGLDDIYNLRSGYTNFIKDSNFNYPKITFNQNNFIDSNEYSIVSIPDDNMTDRIYDKYWKDYLKDLYDRNTRDIVAYVDLSGLGDAKTIMRYFYSYKSHLWIITKLENFKISETVHDKFTKVTLHKIKDKNTWTN